MRLMDTARLAGEAANQVESRRTGPYGVASQAKWDVLYRRDVLAHMDVHSH
jgi:hypothetical protein